MTDLVPHSPTQPARHPDRVLASTAERIRDGVPANTTRSYAAVRRQFEQWCDAHGRDPYPTGPATLADFVSHLCDQGLAPGTISNRRTVISALNQHAGYPPLGKEVTRAARLVQRGYQKQRADAGERAVVQAPPITRERLRQMTGVCDRATLAGVRDRFLLVLGFSLAARRSELASLRMEDVHLVDDELAVMIRTSKTDKESAGVTRTVPRGEHVDTDPVGLYQAWIAALSAAGEYTDAGPLFRGVYRSGKPFRRRTVTRRTGHVVTYGALSGDAVDDIVKRAAVAAGLPQPERYSAHSLRAGFATQAAQDQIPLGVWARHGRWDEKSPVPHSYVRIADEKRDNPLRRMGL